MSQEVSELVSLIRNAIDARLVDMHTAIPAEIVSFDASTQTASVQPSIKRKYVSGAVKSLPVINRVPIVFPSADAGSAILSFPVKKGDNCLLVFSERSIDNWYEKGGTIDPNEPRKFNLSDAFAIMGGLPKTKKSSRASADTVRLEYGSMSLELFKSGKIKLSKIGGDELVSMLSELVELCSAISNSAGPTFNSASFTALKARIDALKG